MIHKKFRISIIPLFFICAILSSCSSLSLASLAQKMMPAVTPTSTLAPALQQLIPTHGYSSIYQTKQVNEASTTTDATLKTFPAQKAIILVGQCSGTGQFTMILKSHLSLPLSCQSSSQLSELDFTPGTISTSEKYEVQVHIEGNVRWEIMVEVHNT
jgi:hypothetical protein